MKCSLPTLAWRAYFAPIAGWWAMRRRAERLLLLGAAALMLVLALSFGLVLPAMRGIDRLQTALPALRVQRDEMLAMAQASHVLREQARSNTAALLPAAVRRAALERSLASAGVTAAEISDEANNRLRLRWAAIDYGLWAAWLPGAERELAARLTRLEVQLVRREGDPPGQVRLDMSFEWRSS